MCKLLEKLDDHIETVLEFVLIVICVATLYDGGAGFMALTAIAV